MSMKPHISKYYLPDNDQECKISAHKMQMDYGGLPALIHIEIYFSTIMTHSGIKS